VAGEMKPNSRRKTNADTTLKLNLIFDGRYSQDLGIFSRPGRQEA